MDELPPQPPAGPYQPPPEPAPAAPPDSGQPELQDSLNLLSRQIERLDSRLAHLETISNKLTIPNIVAWVQLVGIALTFLVFILSLVGLLSLGGNRFD